MPKVAAYFRYKNAHNITPSELAMMNLLLSIDAPDFIFQKPIREKRRSEKFYIADFYIPPPYNIVIEVDGGYHADRTQYDSDRDNMMKRRGVRVMRFTNDEVANDSEKVKIKIRLAILAAEKLSESVPMSYCNPCEQALQ